MKSLPRISALIPIYNGENYVEECVNQVRVNLEEDDEAIFIQNGSTDATLKLLNRFTQDDSRIRIINLKDADLVQSLNIGVSEANNKWIARFDADDSYNPSRIKIQREMITESTSVIFSDYRIVGKHQQDLGTIPSAVQHIPTLVSLYGKNRTAHPSAIFSKEKYLEAGRYRPEDKAVEDLSLWLRMSRTGEFKTAPYPLVSYLLHGKSITSQNRRLSLRNANHLLKDIGVPHGTLEKAILSADEVTSQYDEFSLTYERIALFLLNMKEMSRLIPISPELTKALNRVICRQFMRPGVTLASINLGRDYLSRKKYRDEFVSL